MQDGDNTYDFYIKNFPYIKFLIDNQQLKQTNNLIIIIFYDYNLYKKYIEIKTDKDFMILLKNEFKTYNDFNDQQNGIYMISGNLYRSVDLVIKNCFLGEGQLTKNELKNINIIDGMKDSKDFYISLLRIQYYETEAQMKNIFENIKKQYSGN